MDKFLIGTATVKRKTDVLSTSASTSKISKSRKYDDNYLSIGFSKTLVGGEERPMCVVCGIVLAADSMKPNKLRRHIETVHGATMLTKPREFFERKLLEINKQGKAIKKIATIPEKCQLASYRVSYLIAKAKKPHTIGENLILPAAIEIVKTMFGDTQAQQLKNIPLSDNTVERRISDMSQDINSQLNEKIKHTKFALQVDEATDTAKDAHLIAYVRYDNGDSLNEEMLFCKPIKEQATAKSLFDMLDQYLNDNDIDWKNCISMCSDGAQAMSGKKAGLQALIREKAPDMKWTHCMVHREALASKDMSEELHDVLKIVIKMVNFIKTRPLKARFFGKLCEEMGADHSSLLFYCESRWLSRGKVLERVFELRSELHMFLSENGYNDNTDLLVDAQFCLKLAYLADIFEKLNTLNKSLQGNETNIMQLHDKISGFKKKLKLWQRKLDARDIESFPSLKKFIDSNSLDISDVAPCIRDHFDMMSTNFQKYFEDFDFSQFQWVTNPFGTHADPIGFSISEEEALIDLSNDSTLTLEFNDKSLPYFWLSRKTQFPQLYERAMRVILPFATSYLCETGFSALAAVKTKYRNRLNVENDLRIALSNILPRIDDLCHAKQSHPSH
jgi:zinc finger BED domain-containing protein 5/7/8/9